LLIQYQNTLEDYREMSDAITAARRPVNSPFQIVVLVVVFGFYYAVTRFLWQKAGDEDGQMAWMNMWIAIVAFGFMWLAMSLPASFRARRFPWLTRRQAIALSTFILLIAALVFQHWMSAKVNPRSAHATKLTWQTILPHSIWLLILVYVGAVAGYNHSTAMQRRWDNRPDLHRHQSVDISAEGLTLSDTVTRHEHQWPSFIKGEETRNLFLLFPWESAALMVPKRAFNSDEELEAMRNLMKLIPTTQNTGFQVVPLAQSAIPRADAA
jgi:NADH:ubiquinone oxidoreductase subunit 6 (subunit J)